ncbi:MAG TPA: MAPEG family protein [Thermohalobaculum sp.]|nr:MAPEG family protein [Thermohalobaculum sp.]
MLPITAFYAGLAALWLIYLSGRVIGLRRSRRASLGDGGHDDLPHARAAHRNAAETLPIGLILLALAEGLGAPGLLLHASALLLLAGRVIHAGYFLRPGREMRFRVLGMALTLGTLGFLALGLIAHGLAEMIG